MGSITYIYQFVKEAMAQLRPCKLSDIVTGKTISGSEACRAGRPARLGIDKFKLHYFVHYMHRGTWDELVPEEKEEDLGKIEAYHCNLCPRRFRNNHDKKSYPGRGSIMCHLANEHGKLLKAMRADDKVDMSEEIAAIDAYEKGQFVGAEDPNVPDSEMYTAKESFMWKFQNQKNNDPANHGNSANNNSPNVVPYSRTVMSANDGFRRPKVYECPHCSECKNNMDASRLRLHIFHHYKDRWEHRLEPLERGPNYFYCNLCTKRKQIKGANEEGARMSTICHFAIQHHELRGVLNRDERLPENFVSDLFYDIDLKEGTLDQKKSIETTNSVTVPEAVKSQEPTKKVTAPVKKHEPAQKEISSNKKAPEPSNKTPIATKKAPELSKKVPEPTRGRRPKAASKPKDEWLSSDEDEEPDQPVQKTTGKSAKGPATSPPTKAPPTKKSKR